MKSIILSILTLLSWASAVAADGPALPALFAPPNKDGTLVMNFYIETVAPDEKGDPVITASALDGKQKLTFQLILGREWKLMKGSGTPASGNQLAMGAATIRSVGEPTELFVRAYAKAAKVKVKSYEFSEGHFLVISVGPNPAKMMKEVIGLKVYHGALGGGDYVDLFFQIDILGRSMVVEETNVHWRAAIVRVLTSKMPEKTESKKEG